MADNNTAAPAAPDKPMSFSEITTSNVDLTTDEEAGKTKEAPEVDEDEDTEDEVVDPDELEEEVDDDDDSEPVKERKRADEEEEEEEIEDPDEEEDEDDDGSEDAEKEHLEMSKKLKDDLKVQVKVDGRMEDVTLKELKESYSSRAHNTREAQQIKMEKAEIRQELQKVNNAIGPAWKAIKDGKLETALIELAKLNKMSTLDIKRKLREEMTPGIVAYLKMSPQDREIYDIREENDWRRNQEKEQAEARERESQRQASLDSLRDMQAQHGISDEELQYATDWCRKNAFRDNPEGITREAVLNAALTAKAIDKSLSAIRLKKPSLRQNEKFVDKVIRIAKANPRISIEGLARWIDSNSTKYMPKKEKDQAELVKDISRKVLKNKTKASLENPTKPAKKPMSFGDLL